VADLRRLSIKCEFGEFLDQARFVCGVRSEAIQKKLLVEADLSIKRAQEIAQGMELADKNSKDLKGAVEANVNVATHDATQRKERDSERQRPPA
jgi:hypothetical protein